MLSTQKPNRAEDADKNFDNITAAKRTLIADLLLVILHSLITYRSPIYTTTFLLEIDRRPTSRNF